MTVLGHVKKNDETDYRKRIEHLITWSTKNKLKLNASKTKELIFDTRTGKNPAHSKLLIAGEEVEQVVSSNFSG